MKKKILVAMSGGVDSSVAAVKLRQEGFDIEGAYMKNWINDENVQGDCPWKQDIEDAQKAASLHSIPFRVVNLMKEYREKVVHYLLKEYQEGITPNPDVMCNREIKFGVFLEYALEQGFEGVATGHYARKKMRKDGSWDLLEGFDKNKDQSYFLALLNQMQIERAYFPIGELTKGNVRELARDYGLENAGKKDSQGICFIGEVKMSDFLKSFIPSNPGNIINAEGKVLGKHEGLHLYTLGQRKGILVPSNQYERAYVVIEKRIQTNELVIGFDEPTTKGLYAQKCTLRNLSFTGHSLGKACEFLAKPRYRASAEKIHFTPTGEETAEIFFKKPQRALAPGQICALYDGEVLLGGGIFDRIFPL